MYFPNLFFFNLNSNKISSNWMNPTRHGGDWVAAQKAHRHPRHLRQFAPSTPENVPGLQSLQGAPILVVILFSIIGTGKNKYSPWPWTVASPRPTLSFTFTSLRKKNNENEMEKEHPKNYRIAVAILFAKHFENNVLIIEKNLFYCI